MVKRSKIFIFSSLLLITSLLSCVNKVNKSDGWKLVNKEMSPFIIFDSDTLYQYSEYCINFMQPIIPKKNHLNLYFKDDFGKNVVQIYLNNKECICDKLYFNAVIGMSGYYEFIISNEITNFGLKINGGKKITLDCDSLNYSFIINNKNKVICINSIDKFQPSY